MAAVGVLHVGVARTDEAELFENTHWPRPGLPPAVIGSTGVVHVLLDDAWAAGRVADFRSSAMPRTL
ncbi:MAG: hypothetical protein QOJ06_2388 [Pseudonocardiales bacterium]|nr:hypothetical protein [Pseudonocardiales bacterium]